MRPVISVGFARLQALTVPPVDAVGPLPTVSELEAMLTDILQLLDDPDVLRARANQLTTAFDYATDGPGARVSGKGGIRTLEGALHPLPA
jgi:hypothetical protein